MASQTESAASPNVSRNALLSALAQSAVMISGGINAVIIGSRYSISAETDGLFTAFALYSIVLVVSASTRTALVPRLVDTERRWRPFDAALASLLWGIPAMLLVFLGLGIPILSALTTGDTTLATESLLIFAPAAVLQLVVAIAAAMFAVLGDFVAPAKAFAIGGVMSVVAFLALEPAIGLIALPVATLISSTIIALIVLNGLRRHHWKPREIRPVSLRAARPWIATIGLGSGFYVGAQTLYLVSMVFATAVLAVGNATVYTYAYMTIGLVTAMSSSAGAMALAAPVAESWSGDPRVVEPVEDDVTRALSVVLVIVAGIVATAGAVIATPFLPGFTPTDINALVETTVILSGASLGSAVTITPLAAMFAAHRYGWIAAVAFAGLPAIAVLTALLLQVDKSLVAIALAASLTNFLLAWGVMWLCHGSATPRRIALQLWKIGQVAIPGAVAFLLSDQLLSASDAASNVSHLAAAVLGTVLTAAYVSMVLPTSRRLLIRMIQQTTGLKASQ
ncbi:MAG: polysaccharide biosynthesis C-terminal domain-containing protein [Solirubrobacterales bacterium]